MDQPLPLENARLRQQERAYSPRGAAKRSATGASVAEIAWIVTLAVGFAILIYLYGWYIAQRVASAWCVDCG